jgi:hypothetical protein
MTNGMKIMIADNEYYQTSNLSTCISVLDLISLDS